MDIGSEKLEEKARMVDGRSLLNKISVFGDFAYAVGENSCKGEKY